VRLGRGSLGSPLRRRLLILAAGVVVCLGMVPAAFAGAYSHDSSTGETHVDWMSVLPDSLHLSQLSIPGTHDSGASVSGGDIAFTQSMTIADQLNTGIRAFDIRLGQDIQVQVGVLLLTFCGGPDLWIVHGTLTCQEQKFADVMATMKQFLMAHPSETIVMRLKQDTTKPSASVFESEVAFVLNQFSDYIYQPDFSKAGDLNPTLAQIRGRIVILQNYSADPLTGIPWGFLQKQDCYSQLDNYHLSDKWNDVKEQFVDANAGVPEDFSLFDSGADCGGPGIGDIYANFLSASTGGFPYFFASGKSSPGTNDPALLTGWTRGVIDTCASNSRCIDEYPSVNCFLGTCSVAFEGINDLATDYLNAHPELTRVGIVYADFPGADLIDAIIAVNSRLDVAPPTAPADLISLPPANANGWYDHDVTVTWNWTDGPTGSGVDPANCPAQSTSSGEGDAVLVTGTCKDLAGNEGTASVTLKIDETPPTVSASATTSPNTHGWYDHAVTVQFTCMDALSGIPVDACPTDQVLSSEGAAVSSTPQTVTDAAGNTSDSSNIVTAAIDETPPTASVTNVTPGAQYIAGAVPIAGCSTTDSLSGVAAPATIAVTTGGSNGVGSFTATCFGATDNADNPAAPVTVSYSVVYGFGGFLAPLLKAKNTYQAGSTIPVKFVLTDASGNRLPAPIGTALAATARVQATLSGQGVTPMTVACTWDNANLFFQCNIKTPKLEKVGTSYPYTITAGENLTGSFVRAPTVGAANPVQIYFQ
jgi:1-phosphatidylinositol phosphodiesterase